MNIILNIIMKDEQKVLPRMLASVVPMIDAYCIVDTGSTDNSKHIVRSFFSAKNIPGRIYDHPFENFEESRNFAIEKVKEPRPFFVGTDQTDFCFWLDCDEELILPENFNIKDFKEKLIQGDKGLTTVLYGPQKYGRTSFFRTSKPFRFIGKVHEVLVCDEQAIEIPVPEINILVHPDGKSWENTEAKYRSHARILKKEVEKNNSPRDIFYLAQSYKDAGELKKAIDYYRIRAKREDGFFEERYYAQFMVGVLSNDFNMPYEKILLEYFKCEQLDNNRAEHILNIIILLQNRGLWQTAYIFSKYAMEKYHNKNPYPVRVLFIDVATYNHKILEAHNLNCQQTGRNNEVIDDRTIYDIYTQLCTTPSDINFHLPKLKECAEKYNRCCEMGVRWVVSTYSLLAGKPGKLTSYDINFNPAINKAIEIAKKEKIDFTFKQADILITEIEECDFLFIDTLHNYKQLSQELKLHAPKVLKAIAFHDTNTFGFKDETPSEKPIQGLIPAINEFISLNTEWKVTYQTEENNGFLIIEKN